MAIPSGKHLKMKEVLDSLSIRIFGRSITSSIKQNICVSCGKSATQFKDELSKEEYAISGLCQRCQDIVFSTEED